MFWLGVLSAFVFMFLWVTFENEIESYKQRKENKEQMIKKDIDFLFSELRELKVRVDEIQYSTIPLLEVRVNSCDDREF